MRHENEILAEIIEISKEYERISREIRVKKADLEDFSRHIMLLEAKKDKISAKIKELHEEFGGEKEND